MINIKKNKIIYKNKYNFIYADYIGTCQCSSLIDKYLNKNIYPYYANIHSNSYFSKLMLKYVNKTKKYMRKYLNISDEYVIIFTGNGTTGAINHLVNSIDFKNYKNINIIISLYEHHSNYLPWIEKSKLYILFHYHMMVI